MERERENKFFVVRSEESINVGTLAELRNVFTDDVIERIADFVPMHSERIGNLEFKCLSFSPEKYVERAENTRHNWFEKCGENIKVKKECSRLEGELDVLKAVLRNIRQVLPLNAVEINGDKLEVVDPDTGEIHLI